MTKPLRVVIAEDHYLFREGTRQLLESTGKVTVVASVGDEASLLDAVTRLEPDAVVVDIRMPPDHKTEGIDAARKIRAIHPQTGVVVLSHPWDSDLHDRRIPRHWDSGPSYQWPTPRRLVDRLSADLGDACHSGRLLTGGDQLSGPGGTHAHSQSRNSFPAISNS